MAIKMTSDKEHAATILAALKSNDNYCPCVVEKNPDTKCMCKEFRDMEEGTCHCGLYIKIKD